MPQVSLPSSVRITEVGPRDGLQSQPSIVPTGAKVALVNALAASGVAEIEVTSFVHPKWTPQLADAAEVFSAIERDPGVIYSCLVPNERGLDRALEARVDKIAVFTAASETFSRKNANASIDETLVRFGPVMRRAREAGLPVRAYISCVVVCPWEGEVDPARVRDVAVRLLDLGATEIDLGETIGIAAPADIERLYEGLDDVLSPAESTLHLHDTRGTALACAYRALQLGVRSFDASCAGLGGCPYAPGAAGNLATEDLGHMLAREGIETGVDLRVLVDAAASIMPLLASRPAGRVFRAMQALPPEQCS